MMTVRDIKETKVILADYSQILIPKMPVEVTEAEIEQSINKAREQEVEKVEKSGPAEKFDEVLIDFSGKIGSMQFPTTPVVDYPVVIGTREFYEEIENKMIGTRAGDVLNCVIDMPPEMLLQEYESNTLEVTVTIKKVLEYRLPLLNDEFVSKVSPCKTVEEFREYVREQCRRQKENAKIPVKQNKALSYMIQNSVVDLKQEFIDEKAKELKDSFAEKLEEANCTFEQYLEHVNMTEEQYDERADRDARTILSGSCILYHIGLKENLQVPKEAVDAEIARLDYTGMVSVEELRQRMSSEDLEKIKFTALLQTASMFITSRVVEAES